ncbi:receptor-like protein 18 [Punica granatum]|uniref:non-specific serine/threonine protein kinase n=1 Tax=Punica granatum TaxID=22663 RepID=A0A6P8C834_PUNGR|nr:receptor-like protein 18 [Punica granatum]
MSALLQFKDSIIIDESASNEPRAYPKTKSWKLDGTNGSSPSKCCSWDGVECSDNTGLVIALDLSSSYLYGSIDSSSSLFRLSHLRRIDLSDNDFNQSRIPSEFSLLSGLTHLNLSDSAFSGQIPLEIAKLTGLVSLDLSCNPDSDTRKQDLELPNPGLSTLVQSLTNLEVLSLSSVDISSEVPESITSLSSLRSLFLDPSGIHGVFPAAVFQLPKLQHINLAHNSDLKGQLPYFNSTSLLQRLWLSWTSFSGELPASLGNLRSLKDLRLDNAQFTGPLPNSIGNLHSLNFLDISFCNFLGPIPNSFGSLTKLTYLDIGHSQFIGQLPNSVENLHSLNHLDIYNCNFSGSIPSSFSNLTEITYLDVRENQFTPRALGSLSWLWKMTKLNTWDLNDMSISGEIPATVGNLSQLASLQLDGNQLKGQIPPSIGNLNKLFSLGLNRNELEGHIPLQLMNFTQLTELFLGFNQMSGFIPSYLMNFTQMTHLDLSNNKFEGTIPSSISQLQNLILLRLSRNNLSGAVELDTFLQFKELGFLELSWNKLTCLPATKRNLSLPSFDYLELASCNLNEFPSFLEDQEYTRFHQNLAVLPQNYVYTLDLTSNLLQGQVPVPSASIHSYLLSNNSLTGKLPSLICNLSSLVILDLSFNFLGNTSDTLSVLNLQSNRFSGTIPQFISSGTQLKMISLSQNNFGGKLPRSLANCSRLEFIDFADNQMNDTFPSWLGSLPELRVLILRSNQLHGAIGKPNSNFSFQNLRIIDLSRNSFSGNLPLGYFQHWNSMKVVDNITGGMSYMQESFLPSIHRDTSYYNYTMTIINKGLELYYAKISDVFTAIDLSGNLFTGDIPEVIGELKELHLLNLSNNFLTGQIPASLGNLGALESLDLSRNRLSGEIPQELSRLNFLSVFNVSYNNLTGPIPRGEQFETFPNSSFQGNKGLCGIDLSRKCAESKMEPTGPPTSEADRTSNFRRG